MRKLAIAVALATTALAGPALARDGAWYVGVEGGGLLVEDIDYDLTLANGTELNNAVSVDHEYGFDVGGIVGYDFGVFRAEFEVAYKDANLDGVTLSGLPGNIIPSGAPGISRFVGNGIYEAADGNTRILSFMLNGMFDFGGGESPWNGFIGGGAGIARVKASENQVYKFGAAYVDDSDSGFAWQAIAGIRRELTDRVDLGLKYRFFNADNVKLVAVNGAGAEGRVRSHSLLASLIFNFGEPEVEAPPPPPPAPPAPPPPPPAPPPPPPAPGPFIVFFDWDRSDITPEAASILDRAAEQYQQTGQASVQLAGHADKSGSDQYNVGLSERRAASVRDYLTGKGVPTGVITSEAFGESRPLVETADGVREPQNRRVEITYAGGGGAMASDPMMAPAPTDPAMAPTDPAMAPADPAMAPAPTDPTMTPTDPTTTTTTTTTTTPPQ